MHYSRGNWPLLSEIHLDFDILQLQRLIFMMQNCFCVLEVEFPRYEVSLGYGCHLFGPWLSCLWNMQVGRQSLPFFPLQKLYKTSHCYFVLVPSECVSKAYVFWKSKPSFLFLDLFSHSPRCNVLSPAACQYALLKQLKTKLHWMLSSLLVWSLLFDKLVLSAQSLLPTPEVTTLLCTRGWIHTHSNQ